MKKLIFFVVPLVAALISSGAFAGGGETGARGHTQNKMATSPKADSTAEFKAEFKRMDTSKDKFLQKSEVQGDKKLAKQFNSISKNGKLSQSDYIAWKNKMATKTKKGNWLSNVLHKGSSGTSRPFNTDEVAY